MPHSRPQKLNIDTNEYFYPAPIFQLHARITLS